MAVKKNSTSITAVESTPVETVTTRKRYEYERTFNLTIADFNKRGAQGWRLIADANKWSMWEREIT